MIPESSPSGWRWFKGNPNPYRPASVNSGRAVKHRPLAARMAHDVVLVARRPGPSHWDANPRRDVPPPARNVGLRQPARRCRPSATREPSAFDGRRAEAGFRAGPRPKRMLGALATGGGGQRPTVARTVTGTDVVDANRHEAAGPSRTMAQAVAPVMLLTGGGPGASPWPANKSPASTTRPRQTWHPGLRTSPCPSGLTRVPPVVHPLADPTASRPNYHLSGPTTTRAGGRQQPFQHRSRPWEGASPVPAEVCGPMP